MVEHVRLWRRSWSLIWAAVPGWTTSWAILIGLQGIMPVVIVYMTKLAIDSFVYARNNHDDVASFNRSVIFFVLTGFAFLLAQFFSQVADWVKTAQTEYFSDYLNNLVHAKSGDVDLEFYATPEYQDLMERAQGESQSKPLSLLGSFGAIVQSFITLVTFAALLVSYGWEVPILLVVGTIPGLYLTLKYNRIYHKWWETTTAERRWLSYFNAMLSNATPAPEMRIFDLNETFRDKFQKLRQRLRSERLHYLRRRLQGKLISNFLVLAVAGAAIGWMAYGVYNNTATLGDLAVFYQVFSRGQTILSSLFTAVGQMIGDTLFLKSLFSFLDLTPKVVSPLKPKRFPDEIKHGIKFSGVTFYYPGESKPALQNLHLFVSAGQKIAIVGQNGAGKSTLFNLLCRFYDPQKGMIEIDGIDIREFDLKALRRNISVLFQFPARFQESATDNIAYGDIRIEPDDAVIETAAKRAGAHSAIMRLSEGYKTVLGRYFVNGSELSGGEWQKVALARAYFRQAQIVVLDEPTSFMDSWGEVEWYNRFLDLAENRTALIITHRFTIAMLADIIHVMDDSRIVESGTHSELLASNGLYANSWNSQMDSAQARLVD